MNGRQHHGYVLAASVIPLLGFAVAIVLLWNTLVGPADLAALVLMYLLTGLGVTVGYHRLLAHRSFRTTRAVKIALVVCGSMAGQAPPLIWTAHHRRHHRVADRPGDPHSPYDDERTGLIAALKGLWHAHMGWLFDTNLSSDPVRYCPDLARDRDIRVISRNFLPIVLAGVVLPGLLGLALTASAAGMLSAALWGGPVRILLLNHTTYAVNSVGHYFGTRRFATPDESRNVAWLAIPSLGESWHNNHHAFPKSASHGMRWWEPDLSALLVRGLEAAGLAWDVVRVDRERQDEKMRTWARMPRSGRHARITDAAHDE
ncbi:acyl-CoA desaturase [Amycolatopsis sp. NPDC005003]